MLTPEKKWHLNTPTQNILLVNTVVNIVPRFVPPNTPWPVTSGPITSDLTLYLWLFTFNSILKFDRWHLPLTFNKELWLFPGSLLEPWVCPQTGYIHCSKGCGSKFKNLAPLKRHEEVCTFSNLANIPKNVPLQVIKTDRNVATSDKSSKQRLIVKDFAIKSIYVEPKIKEEKQ